MPLIFNSPLASSLLFLVMNYTDVQHQWLAMNPGYDSTAFPVDLFLMCKIDIKGDDRLYPERAIE